MIPIPDNVLKALCAGVGLVFIWRAGALAGQVKSWKGRTALHAASGLAALFTGDLVGALAGLGVGLNALTLAMSAVLGVPGVALAWAVKYLL